jgi:hypothetical protein
MPQENRNRKLARAAICAAFGVFLVVAGGIAVAYAEDDDDDTLPDEKFMKSFLRGLGLRNGQEAGIEYKERPPLVLPPSRTLPPPAAANASLAKNNPAWPVDPDEVKRKAERKAKAERKPVDYNNDVRHDRLTAQEWSVGTSTNSGPTQAPERRVGADQYGNVGNTEMTPAELGYKNTLWDSMVDFANGFKTTRDPESKVFLREPVRNSLTDPPAGYRSPAPTQPYGVGTRDSGVEAKGKVDPQTVRGER